MAGNDDLFKALQMFQGGVQQFALQRAIGSANETVQQLKSSDLDEQKKRAELSNISNQLVAQMAGIGAPASTIQAVSGALGPKVYGSAAEAAQMGDTNALATFDTQDEKKRANDIKLLKEKHALDVDLLQKKTRAAMEVKGVAGAKQQPGDVEFATNVEVAMKEANKLEKLVGKFGGYENSVLGNTKASAMLDSSSYQLAINYAKIVDPASVAREGEVAAAQKYLIPLGMGTPNAKSIAAIKEYKAKIKEYVTARGKAKAKGPTAQAPATAENTPSDDVSNFFFE